ncbi:MAG: glycosyltransferase [Hyphomicrobiales bacterium]
MLAFEYFTTLELVGLIALGISLFFQLIYYWFIFGRLAFHRKRKNDLKQVPVSIVISARNEYENLRKNLPVILDQEYSDFEVVVVDDNSDDETEGLLKELATIYPKLKPVRIHQQVNVFSGKKFPLSIGIKSARNELLLLTDADCKPSSPYWLKEMQEAFNDNTDLVLGFSPFAKKPGLLNALIRWDNLHAAIKYLSFALIGTPYKGEGRNIAYKRSLFMKNNGFTQHYGISSGDDDLFVSQIGNRKNTRIQVSSISHTISDSEISYSKWWRKQKENKIKAKFYKKRFKFLLGLYQFTNLIFYLSLIELAYFSEQYYLIGGLFAIKLLSQIFIFKMCTIKLGIKQWISVGVVLDLIYTFLNPIIAFSNLMVNKSQWK